MSHQVATRKLIRSLTPDFLSLTPRMSLSVLRPSVLPLLVPPAGWYRPPELLFGARRYTAAVDLWAVGAVVAELMTFAPLFPGSNDIDQICKVFQVLGTPTAESWPVSAVLAVLCCVGCAVLCMLHCIVVCMLHCIAFCCVIL